MDSMLFTAPVSSCLHPQLGVPLLKGFLQNQGYQVKAIDSNILFYHYFLGGNPKLELEDCLKNPISILGYYSDLERKLWENSKNWDGFHIGLRTLSMKYDRIYFDSVLQALTDTKANPFIEFYDCIVSERIGQGQPKLVGIAITFQDQIIPAFTLAHRIREHYPHIKIAFGGQMITRCQQTMRASKTLEALYDYLVLWDGEKGIHDIHRRVVDNQKVDFVNVIPTNGENYRIDRASNSPEPEEVPSPDFSDFDFDQYLYPDILIPLQTTRGCYAHCAFCAIPFGANKYTVRSPQTIVDEMVRIHEEIKEKYKRKAVYFKFMEDTSSPAILGKVSQEIENRGLDFKWETFARLEKAFAKPGMMDQLYRGGCRKINWGLESNDPDVLVKMNKKTQMSFTDEVLRLSGEAGVLNFCFVLVGFPTETDEMRENMVQYIVGNKHIHTLTLTTFDLTRGSPMEQNFEKDNEYQLDMVPAEGFQVRLPYTVSGENWKQKIIPAAHKMMVKIVRQRPDIGFVTLFPDQIRSLFCEEFGNDWGKVFVEKYGQNAVREMLLNVEKYALDYQNQKKISPEDLPEPLRREHYRTKEDLQLIADAMKMRKAYENKRFDQV